MAVAACVGVLAAACGGGPKDDAPAGATTGAGVTPGGIPLKLRTISVADNRFTPANLQVPAGTGVAWEWTGKGTHSVTGTFNGQEVKSQVQDHGTFTFDFPGPGVFEYQCAVHTAQMTGRVTVLQ